MRTCTLCKIEKEATAFYAHPRSRDKLQTRCIACYQKRPRRTTPIKEFKTPIALLIKRREYKKRHREKHPQKDTARNVLHAAVQSGKIAKQPCVVCGNLKTHGHHVDYTKPLEVIWLCKKHHDEVHKYGAPRQTVAE